MLVVVHDSFNKINISGPVVVEEEVGEISGYLDIPDIGEKGTLSLSQLLRLQSI